MEVGGHELSSLAHVSSRSPALAITVVDIHGSVGAISQDAAEQSVLWRAAASVATDYPSTADSMTALH